MYRFLHRIFLRHCPKHLFDVSFRRKWEGRVHHQTNWSKMCIKVKKLYNFENYFGYLQVSEYLLQNIWAVFSAFDVFSIMGRNWDFMSIF